MVDILLRFEGGLVWAIIRHLRNILHAVFVEQQKLDGNPAVLVENLGVMFWVVHLVRRGTTIAPKTKSASVGDWEVKPGRSRGCESSCGAI
jgi:hypothetical protein